MALSISTVTTGEWLKLLTGILGDRVESAGWDLSQRFVLRASTMLLIFTGVIAALGLSDYLFELFIKLAPDSGTLLWRFGVNVEKYALIAALIAFGFLGYSLYRKNPQLQFIMEMILCLVIFLIV